MWYVGKEVNTRLGNFSFTRTIRLAMIGLLESVGRDARCFHRVSQGILSRLNVAFLMVYA